jgi:uncharacterized protein YjiS (DUF1127 family)
MPVTPAARTARMTLSKGAWLVLSLLMRLSTTIDIWIERSRQRHALGELAGNDHLLADVGLSLEQARREARKPFWVFSKEAVLTFTTSLKAPRHRRAVAVRPVY